MMMTQARVLPVDGWEVIKFWLYFESGTNRLDIWNENKRRVKDSYKVLDLKYQIWVSIHWKDEGCDAEVLYLLSMGGGPKFSFGHVKYERKWKKLKNSTRNIWLYYKEQHKNKYTRRRRRPEKHRESI